MFKKNIWEGFLGSVAAISKERKKPKSSLRPFFCTVCANNILYVSCVKNIVAFGKIFSFISGFFCHLRFGFLYGTYDVARSPIKKFPVLPCARVKTSSSGIKERRFFWERRGGGMVGASTTHPPQKKGVEESSDNPKITQIASSDNGKTRHKNLFWLLSVLFVSRRVGIIWRKE